MTLLPVQVVTTIHNNEWRQQRRSLQVVTTTCHHHHHHHHRPQSRQSMKRMSILPMSVVGRLGLVMSVLLLVMTWDGIILMSSHDVQYYRMFTAVVVVDVAVPVVQAYSSGAGSCPNGIPAVGGIHTEIVNEKFIRRSNLIDNDFIVTMNDTVITPTTTQSFSINTPYTLSVYNNRFLYKGILVRMLVPTTNTTNTTTATEFTFLPLTNTQSSLACFSQGSNVAGITHRNNTLKSIHSGIVQVDQPIANVTFDITVVGVNNDTISLYGYDRFYIHFIDPTTTVVTDTINPTVSPITTPISVLVPVVTPTESPTITTPNVAPTKVPIITNSTTPTTTTTAPTEAPTTATTNIVVVPKLRKNVNLTNDQGGNGNILFTAENVLVRLSYIVSSTLTDAEIRAYERITSKWYADFYNDNFYTIHNATTNATDIITITNTADPTNDTAATERDTNNNSQRQLQKETNELIPLQLSNNYGIILGSMTSTINVINVTYTRFVEESVDDENGDNMNATTKTNVQITYTQRISYQSSTDISDTKQSMQQQYITIPYRSRIGRQLYVQSLTESNIYTFSHLKYRNITSTETLSVPELFGPPPQSIEPTESETTTEKEKFANGYIAVITVGGIVAIAAAIIIYQNNKYRFGPKNVTDEEVSASMLLAQQRQQCNDDMQHVRNDNTDTTSGGSKKNTIATSNNASNGEYSEYVIYAPAGRLGIILDDPNVLSYTSKNDLQCGPVISMIKEGSPLIDDSNMNVGDFIVAIDDIDVRNMSPQRVSKLINDRSKHPIRKITCIHIPNMIQNINLPA